MLKKIFVSVLALALMLSVFTCGVLAESEEAPSCVASGTNLIAEGSTNTDLVAAETRGMTAFLMLYDYSVGFDSDILNKADLNGTGYIGAYGQNCVDLYLPMNDGTYLNLFYAIHLGNLYNYGTGNWDFNSSDFSTYAAFPCSEIVDAARVVSEMSGN